MILVLEIVAENALSASYEVAREPDIRGVLDEFRIEDIETILYIKGKINVFRMIAYKNWIKDIPGIHIDKHRIQDILNIHSDNEWQIAVFRSESSICEIGILIYSVEVQHCGFWRDVP